MSVRNFIVVYATIIAVGVLLIRFAHAADQKTLDFCIEYIGEAIKAKPEQRNEWIQPIYRGKLPAFESHSTVGMQMIQPIYRRAIQFNSISTVQRRY